jgi:AraC-like DNA-binding protein/quercetin dioxygenase-like cupin family protein
MLKDRADGGAGQEVLAIPFPDETWVGAIQRVTPCARVGEVELSFFYWGYAKNHPDNQPHRHSFYEVCYVSGGTGRFFHGGAWHGVRPGDVFIARPGFVHQIVSDGEGMELYWVAYSWETAGGQESELSELFRNLARSSRLVAHDDGRLANVWPTLRITARQEEPGTACQLECLMSSIVVSIGQLLCPKPSLASVIQRDVVDRESGLIRQAVLYIHANLAEHLTIAEVSRHVNVSPRHFCRLFNHYMGCTFVQYLHHLRLDMARTLLCDPGRSIQQVAERVGLPDVHYFTRLFTRAVGVPPSRYRIHPEEYGRGSPAPGIYL